MEDLPLEILSHIVIDLNLDDINNLFLTCRAMYKLSKYEYFWRLMNKTYFDKNVTFSLFLNEYDDGYEKTKFYNEYLDLIEKINSMFKCNYNNDNEDFIQTIPKNLQTKYLQKRILKIDKNYFNYIKEPHEEITVLYLKNLNLMIIV
jgi:hypothetical protein